MRQDSPRKNDASISTSVREREVKYLEVIRNTLAVCKNYRPRFGKRKVGGYSLDEFRSLYQEDCFYSWFGLDSPLVYAAHKAAGGITSVYRQIGLGCERVFNLVLQDTLGLTATQASWNYTVKTSSGRTRTLSLDGRIPVDEIQSVEGRKRIRQWIAVICRFLELRSSVSKNLKGTVFEVRQGYKSKDAKRQNADIANAANAYAHSYVPVVCLFSTQIDDDIVDRYLRAKWVILQGTLAGSPLDSTYVFCKDVLGYDLADFFQRHKAVLQKDMQEIIEVLLR